MDVQATIEKIKELIRKGNVSRVVIRRGGEQILSLPVNVSIIGGAVMGLTSAKWILLAGVLATIGFGCTVEVVKADGEVVNVMDEEQGQKVRDFASDTVEKVKETIPVSITVDIKKDGEEVVDAEVEEIADDPAESKD